MVYFHFLIFVVKIVDVIFGWLYCVIFCSSFCASLNFCSNFCSILVPIFVWNLCHFCISYRLIFVRSLVHFLFNICFTFFDFSIICRKTCAFFIVFLSFFVRFLNADWLVQLFSFLVTVFMRPRFCAICFDWKLFPLTTDWLFLLLWIQNSEICWQESCFSWKWWAAGLYIRGLASCVCFIVLFCTSVYYYQNLDSFTCFFGVNVIFLAFVEKHVAVETSRFHACSLLLLGTRLHHLHIISVSSQATERGSSIIL